MALTVQNDGAALAAGAPIPAGTRRVRVLRPFIFRGEPTKVGDEIDLPRLVAIDVIAGNKAEAVPPKAAKAAKS